MHNQNDPGTAGHQDSTAPPAGADAASGEQQVVLGRGRVDAAAGGEDSSPLETLSSDEKAEAVRRPQDAPRP